MSFQIQSQTINAGTPGIFTFPAAVGTYLYGITAFELNTGGAEDVSSASITLSPTLSNDSKTLTIGVDMEIYLNQTANNWVTVTVLAWLGTENPSGIFLFNRTGIGPGTSIEPVSLDGQPVVAASVLSGFDLSFTKGSAYVLGLGASAGCILSPYSVTPAALPIGQGLLNGNQSSNTVDAFSIVLTTAFENVYAGMLIDNTTGYGSNPYSVQTPAAPTQVAVFLQSFYLQYQVSSSLQPQDLKVSYVEVGASNLEVSGSGFSISSTRELENSQVQSTTVSSDGYPVTVNVPVTYQANSLAAAYLYVALVSPSVSALSANNSGTTAGGSQNNPVTVTGTNFTSDAVVYFGMVQADTTFVSSTQLTAVPPPSPVAGPVDIYVETSAGTSPQNAACQYNYQLAAPTITNVNPNTGPVAGGTPVAISGSGFVVEPGSDLTITRVLFGAVPATGLSYNSATGELICTSPASTEADTVDIVATNAQGTSVSSPNCDFTYSAPS